MKLLTMPFFILSIKETPLRSLVPAPLAPLPNPSRVQASRRSQDISKPRDDSSDRRWDRPRVRRFADRKSTRLNSSHGYISYAVFCLKKKKKKKNDTEHTTKKNTSTTRTRINEQSSS